MTDFSFEVGGQPPSVNHLYVRVRGDWSRMAKAKGVEQYQNDIIWLCRAARPSGWHPPEGGQLKIWYRFHLKRDADVDNLLKAINDAVANALGVNDRCFLPCVMEKTVGNKSPYTEIGITALPLPSSQPETSSASGSPTTSPRKSTNSLTGP